MTLPDRCLARVTSSANSVPPSTRWATAHRLVALDVEAFGHETPLVTGTRSSTNRSQSGIFPPARDKGPITSDSSVVTVHGGKAALDESPAALPARTTT